MNRIIITLCVLFICLSVYSRQLFFSGYSIADGLSQSVVNCIFQDSKGYIWMGTQNGLNRFDGYSFKVRTYKPDDPNSITNRWIYAIAEDKEGNLWIGTKRGLNKYYRKENRFEEIEYSIPYNIDVTEYVYDVKCARNGDILINTPPVLTICDPQTMSFRHHILPVAYDGGVGDYNIPLLEATDGKIWVGSTRGLACYIPYLNKSLVFSYDPENVVSISDNNITALYQDNKGNIWIGTSNGLNRLNNDGQTFKRYFNESGNGLSPGNNYIRAIQGDKYGNLWIATEGRGLNCMSVNAHGKAVFETFLAGNSGLNHNIILSLELDRSENLWIGTLSGVNKTDLKKQKFKLYRNSDSPYSVDLAGNVIASLYKDDGNRIWVGNWGQGLNMFDRNTGKVEHFSSHLTGRNYIPNNFVHTIFEDYKHRIWIGTRDGLLVYSRNTRRFVRPGQLPDNPGLPELTGLRIFTMIQGQNGEYWIATQDGLFRKKSGESPPERFHKVATPDQRISSNLVYGLLEDSEGLIWIATTEGLDLYDPGTSSIRHFRNKDDETNLLADNFIISLCEDHKGDIWIGTGSYAYRFSKRDSVFTYYSTEEGLPGNLAYTIMKDKSNGLWFATGNGLSRYDYDTDSFHTYSVAEGLQSLEFNLGASFLSDDGEVFLGGMNGFNSFYPDSLTNNPYIPEIVFTSAYKMKNGIKEYLDTEKSNGIELNYNDYSFSVEFAALEFTNPSRNSYKYCLEGVDDGWIDIGNRNFVPFTKLPSGKYVFRVKASNNDGLWNEEGAGIDIFIHPPWWRSDIVYFCYTVLTILLIFVIFKSRERHHVRNRRMLEAKVKERTVQIEQQKTEIMGKNAQLNEVNASKDKFFSIIAHDLRNPFNSIIGLSDVLLMNLPDIDNAKLKKYLENIKGSSQQAYELLENLLLQTS